MRILITSMLFILSSLSAFGIRQDQEELKIPYKNKYLGINDYAEVVEKEISQQITSARALVEQGLQAAELAEDFYGIGRMYMLMAQVYYHEGDNQEAIHWNRRALQFFNESRFPEEAAEIHRAQGRVFERMGNLAGALQQWNRAMEILKTLEGTAGSGRILSSIATLYTRMNNPQKAIAFEKDAFKSNAINQDSTGMAISLNNIGNNLKDLGQYREALDYLWRSLQIHRSLDDRAGMIYNYATFGEAYLGLDMADSAKYYAMLSLNNAMELKDPYEIAYGYHDLGRVLMAMGDRKLALANLVTAYHRAVEINAWDLRESSTKSLADVYEGLGKTDSAHHYLKEYLVAKEKFWSEESIKLEELNNYFSDEKRQAEIDILLKDKQLAEIQIERTTLLNYLASVTIVGILMVFMAFFRQYEQKRQLNNLLQAKNIDINASLLYASRIQEAMLPSQNMLDGYLNNSFVYFKPRDIVSGDFYWLSDNNDDTVIVAADCTGHGVPGAFMSMIGMEKLSEIINIRGVSDPAAILTQLNDGVKQALRQEESQNNDGMDIAICVVPKAESDAKVKFAGAKNPIVITWEDKNGNILLEEHRGDRYSIGGFFEGDQSPQFKTIMLDLSEKKNAFCYIFSDGYQDQFGGELNKKFMKKRLRKLFASIHNMGAHEKKEVLAKEMEHWMQGEEQVDDMLVVGFQPF